MEVGKVYQLMVRGRGLSNFVGSVLVLLIRGCVFNAESEKQVLLIWVYAFIRAHPL